jgi:VanZ family protein
VAAWSALLFALSAVPGTSYPTVGFSLADKIVHVLVYAPLGFWTARALWGPDPRAVGRAGRVLVLAALLCTLYGASDELHQAFVPLRSPDWRDLLADAFGGLLGATAAVALARRRSAGKVERIGHPPDDAIESTRRP